MMKRVDVCKTISDLNGEAGHKKIMEVYNAQNPLPRGYRLQAEDPWCAATVSAVFLMNGYNAFSECSCLMMIKKAKELGLWKENDAYVPEPGDVIMYDWQDQGTGDNVGVADHTGIVIGVSENKITVREGNYNKSIKERTIKVNGRYIRGYIVPPYDTEAISDEIAILPTDYAPETPKSEEKPLGESQNISEYGFTVGKTYTVNVRTALNVRKGPGMNYALVGYANLTADGKKHATEAGSLLPGTKVTCQELQKDFYGNIWMRIPSGWISAKYVK